MDRTAWIVVTLCTLGLLYFLSQDQGRQVPAAPPVAPAPASPGAGAGAGAEAGAGAGAGAGSEAEAPGVGEGVAGAPPAQRGPGFSAPPADEKTVVLKNQVAELTFSTIGGGIRTARLLHHKNEGGGLVELNRYGRAPIGGLSRIAGQPEDTLAYTVNEDETTGSTVVFEADTPENLRIRKVYRLGKIDEGADPATAHPDELAHGYLCDLEITLTSTAGAPVTAANFYLYTGTGEPLQPNEWIKPSVCWNDGGEVDNEDVGYFGGGGFLGMRFREERDEFHRSVASLGFAGVHNQFFTTLVTPEAALANSDVWARRLPASLPAESAAPEGQKGPFYAIEGAFSLPVTTVSPGAPSTVKMDIYVGPRSFNGLASLGQNREKVMFYGMFWWVSQPLMTVLLWLRDHVGQFGIAIICLTILIRIVIWPLYAKSTRTMKRMSLLSPKMNEVREKYKDNPQKQQQEMMKLYKDYGVNPFGGCLPMFIQLPIFFGFYRMLQSAVELRGQSFLWAQDLAMPDTVANLPEFIPFLGGAPLNPLPLLMGGTMFLQMAIAPSTGDKTQQRIFMIMPFFFLFICYNFASALALYWTTQNIFGIVQTWLTQRMPEPELEKKAAGASKGKPGWPPAPGGKPAKKPKPSAPRTGGAAKSARKKKAT